VLLQLGLVLLVESQAAQDSNGCDNDFPDGEPNVREMNVVGLFAVGPDCERDGGRDPDNDRRWDKYKDAVPIALEHK
jgi:hypothetical protein